MTAKAITAKAILTEIKPLGSESYKRILFSHGVTDPCFGVKIEDLKKIQKWIELPQVARPLARNPPRAGVSL